MTRWRNENLLRSIAIVFIFFCVVFSLFTLFRILLLYRLLDFGVYYQAVEKIINGCNPYVSSVGEMVFIYPPTALLFLLPLHFFPISIAEDLWTLTSFITFGCSVAQQATLAVLLLSKSISLNIFNRQFGLL